MVVCAAVIYDDHDAAAKAASRSVASATPGASGSSGGGFVVHHAICREYRIRYDGVIRGSTHARLALRRPAATNRHNISGMHATCSLDHMYEPSRSEREPKSSHSARPHWANADVMRSRSGPERAPSGHSPSAEQSSAPVAIWTVLRVGPAGHYWAQVDSHTATSAQQLSII